MDWLDFVFEGVSTVVGTHWKVFSVLIVAGVFAGAFLGRFQGRREARHELTALRAERDASTREKAAAEETLALRDQTLAEQSEKLAESARLIGEKDIETAQIAAERDRAVAHSDAAQRSLEKVRGVFADDIWREHWSDPRADGGGAERAFGRSPIPIIAVGNLKGGVGKTTTAGNLGAFLAARANASATLKPVLFIDLDFQGSLSATMLYESGLAADVQRPAEIDFRVKELFRDNLQPRDKLSMARSFTRPEINRSAFFDCDYPAFRLEDELLYSWVLQGGPKSDIRLRLAEFLYSTEVRERFGAVVLDLPPRTTTFAVNALCAATDLIIPARTDELSLKAVPRFVSELTRYREHLWPHLRVSGVIGTMTQRHEASETEKALLEQARAVAAAEWNAPQQPIADLGTIPAKASISANAGQQFQYFIKSDGSSYPPHAIFSQFGERVLESLSRLPG